jgi:ribonuclease-3
MNDVPDPLPLERPADPVEALEARLGFVFADRRTALSALTHKSYVNEHKDEEGLCDNERLEFLGDAVIDLAVSHRLMERFPGAREGELSKMRAAVVDEQGLSEMARALGLGGLLRLGRGEELTGGRRKASLLADAMEAVIAAVYLEAGLSLVLGMIDRFLTESFARASAGTLDRDWKTQLQELAQSRLRATPRYRVVAEHGPDHSKLFEVETDLRGEVVGKGTGRSKKDAEQAAAKLALDQLAGRSAPPAAPERAVGAEAVGESGSEPESESVSGSEAGAGPDSESGSGSEPAPESVTPPKPRRLRKRPAAKPARRKPARKAKATPRKVPRGTRRPRA